MKKYIRILALLIVSLFISITSLVAQPGGPPDDPNDLGGGGEPIGGGGAPLSGQTVVLFSMALAYIGIKTYNYYQKTHNDSKELM